MDCARHRAIYNSVRNDDFPLDDCLVTQYESTRLFTERDDIPRNAAVHPQPPTEVDVAINVGSYSNQRINLTLGFLCFSEHSSSSFIRTSSLSAYAFPVTRLSQIPLPAYCLRLHLAAS